MSLPLNLASVMNAVRGGSSNQSTTYFSEGLSGTEFAIQRFESINETLALDYDLQSGAVMKVITEGISSPSEIAAINEGIISGLGSHLKALWEKIVAGVKGLGAKIKQKADSLRLSGEQLANKSEYVKLVKAKNYSDFRWDGYDFASIDANFAKLASIESFVGGSKVAVKFNDFSKLNYTGTDEKECSKQIEQFHKDNTEKLENAHSDLDKIKTAYYKECTGISEGGDKMTSDKMKELLMKKIHNGKTTETVDRKDFKIDNVIEALKNPKNVQGIKDAYTSLEDEVVKLKNAVDDQVREWENANDASGVTAIITKLNDAKIKFIKAFSVLYDALLAVASLINETKLAGITEEMHQNAALFKKAMAYKNPKKNNNSFAFDDEEDMNIDFLGELDMLSEE